MLNATASTSMAQSLSKQALPNQLENNKKPLLAFKESALSHGDLLTVTPKIAGSTLLGAGLSAVAQSIGATAVSSGYTTVFKGPTSTGMGLGAALGLGISLRHIETGNTTTNKIKNVLSGGLIGGASLGIATSIGKTMFSSAVYKSGPGYVLNIAKTPAAAVLAGVAVGVGISLLTMKEQD